MALVKIGSLRQTSTQRQYLAGTKTLNPGLRLSVFFKRENPD
jgi:hypothetical protein